MSENTTFEARRRAAFAAAVDYMGSLRLASAGDEGAGDPGAQSEIVERSAGGEGPLSAREAALSLVDTRRKDTAGQRRDDEQDDSGEARDDATAEESAERQDTAREDGPGETQADDQEQETAPPIEPPRSWTKEDKELFKGLPRETQERLADRERSREADFLKRQNAAAEQSKGLTAKEQAAEQVRAQYEQALPMLLNALSEQHQGEFADIKSIADVERLAREDWPRYVLWDAQQKKIAAVQQQVTAAQQRQTQAKQAKLNTFMSDENARFLEKAPELADAKAMKAAQEGAVAMLKELGFTDDDLGKSWRGEKDISIHDHRLHLLIRDGVRYREAQAKAKAQQQKPVPKVQRPGPAPARGADADEQVKNLNERLTTSGSLRDAAALLAAQRRARR